MPPGSSQFRPMWISWHGKIFCFEENDIKRGNKKSSGHGISKSSGEKRDIFGETILRVNFMNILLEILVFIYEKSISFSSHFKFWTTCISRNILSKLYNYFQLNLQIVFKITSWLLTRKRMVFAFGDVIISRRTCQWFPIKIDNVDEETAIEETKLVLKLIFKYIYKQFFQFF